MRLCKGVVALAVLWSTLLPAAAQTISGEIYEDRDGDGIRDAGEPALSGVDVRLFGSGVDQTVGSAADGSFSFSPGNGCYVVAPIDPVGWRLSQTREDGVAQSTPGYTPPVGISRFSKLDRIIDNLQGANFVYASVGDSIAWNWNVCSYPEQFWYSRRVRDRLACVAPSTSVFLTEAAIKGEHTDDLMVDEVGEFNNVFRLLNLHPHLVTISMIGNDLLNVDPGGSPTQTEINRAVAEVIDARANLQEVLSSLIAGLPDVDIALDTQYDNEADTCYSGSPSDFHRTWVPIVNHMVRELAWGQARRVAVNEIAAEFAHENQFGVCTGFDNLICHALFQLDEIHPRNEGYAVIREKVWEALGGVGLGPVDALGRTSMPGVNHGYLRLVRQLSPGTWEVRNGATIANPANAFDGRDQGAAASITLGSGSQEVRLAGFPSWYDEVQIVRVIVGVRYRTTGTVTDDFYRMEASIDDTFRPPPGHAYTPTNWNFYTPIVGAGGPNQPPEHPDYSNAEVLALPDVLNNRTVTAQLGKNPVLPPVTAEYEWPAVTHEELGTTTLRIAAAPVAGTAGNDDYTIELDHAWLDLYGWEKPRPDEVQDLRVDRMANGDLEVSFDSLNAAERYNLYVGRIASIHAGAYDHGASAPTGPECAAATESVGGGRLGIGLSAAQLAGESAYFLVSGHVDGVESPTGFASDETEIDRSQSVCR